MARRCSLILGLIALFSFAASAAHASLALDTSFSKDGYLLMGNDAQMFDLSGLTPLRSGGIIVAGHDFDRQETHDWVLRVFTRAGRPDTRFGKEGVITFPRAVERYTIFDSMPGAVVQRDGKILVYGVVNVTTPSDLRRCDCRGERRGWGIVRMLPDGKIDQSYGSSGIAFLRGTDAGVHSDGSGREPEVRSAEIDSRGGLVLFGATFDAGQGWTPEYGYDTGVVMLRADRHGRQDARFGAHGRVLMRAFDDEPGMSMAIRKDGALITVRERPSGRFMQNGKARLEVRRFDAAGRPLGGRGENRSYSHLLVPVDTRLNNSVWTWADARGRVLAESSTADDQLAPSITYRRFAPNGALDRTFGHAGRLTIDTTPSGFGGLKWWAMNPALDGGLSRLALSFAVGDQGFATDNELLGFDDRGRPSPDAQGRLYRPLPRIPGIDYSADQVLPAADRKLYVFGYERSLSADRDGHVLMRLSR